MKLTRRSVLRAAGGIAVGLPFLEMSMPRRAMAAPRPKRLVVFVHGQGTIKNQWTPAQTGSGFALSPLLAALEPHKSKLNVWSRISNVVRARMSGNGHNPAGRSLLSAHVFSNPGNEGSASAGPSIEQVIARRIQEGARLRTLDLRVGPYGVGEYQMMFSAPGEPVGAEADPRKAADRVFVDVGAPAAPGPRERLRAARGSVLDAVRGNFASLMAQAGREDRIRLQAHAAKIESLQATVAKAPTMGVGCSRPGLGLPPDYTAGSASRDPITNAAMAKIAAMALACDVTRVVTIQHTEYHDPKFPWLNVGLPGNWHDFVHRKGADAPQKLFAGFAWYTSAFKTLLDELAAVDDGGQSLLDGTLVLWISEFGDGGAHDTNDLPVVLAGGLGGALRTGRHLAFPGRSTNDLYVTLLNLFGGTDTQFGFGGSDTNKGPLPIA